MDYPMSNYYEVLQYLRETKVDREYPYEFDNTNSLTYSGTTPLELTNEHISNHNSSIHLSNVKSGDTLLIKLDKPKSYQEVNTFEVNLYSTSEATINDIEIILSDSPIGVSKKLTLTPDEGMEYSKENINNLIYNVDDRTSKVQKKNREVAAIQSIILTFKKDLGDVYISETVFRTKNFHYTLENLDYNIRAGQDYVRMQLYLANVTDIPDVLTYLNFKAAAAYSWLIWWEDEGKAMNDGTVNGENYAARLFGQIDAAIEKYVKANPTVLADEINLNMIGWTGYENVHYSKPVTQNDIFYWRKP